MKLIDVFSKRSRQVTLTAERWNHIVLRHPEMDIYLDELKKVLQNPDLIIQDNLDFNIIFYHKYYKEEKQYIVLVVEEEKEFIITAYITQKPKRGTVLWQKK